MRLFHGSNMEIDEVDLSKCLPNKDFGCGFYTTLLEEQAWRICQGMFCNDILKFVKVYYIITVGK